MSEARLQNEAKPMSPRQEKWNHYKDSMKYAFHVIFHPFDGFWDLIHEKRGSLAAATTWLALFLITRVIVLMYTNFQFINAPLQYINVFEQMASLLFPFLILCLANWSLTTLFDGKGRFKDIYMAMCYALVPYVLIQLPLVFVSNIIAFDEAAFYSVLLSVSLIWCLLLAFVGLMQVHDYGPGKTIIFVIATILGTLIILFLMLVFLSLLSDALSYFVSLYREIAFRLY
ncbi:MAG: YIP1 family protein [Clostridia bacterium]|nr:YIP1 family protein [Clostridia bacterium]MBP3651396.1 YIP1 family protein [Clostridia bacterium]